MRTSTLLLFPLCIEFGAAPAVGDAAPVPKAKPVIECNLIVTGRLGDASIPDGGEVVISNVSSETVDIGTKVGPLGHLDLKVTDSKSSAIETPPVASFLSPSFDHKPYLLKPGESYRAPLALLFTVPAAVKSPGNYKVRATFELQGKSCESGSVDVVWVRL